MSLTTDIAATYVPFDSDAVSRRLSHLQAVRSEADAEIGSIRRSLIDDLRQRRALLQKIDENIAVLEDAMSRLNPITAADLAMPSVSGAADFGHHRKASSNAMLGWSSPRDVVSTAHRILKQRGTGMKRRDLFRAVQSTGLTMPGTNAVKNFGTLIGRSRLFARRDGKYHLA